jgi:hypothetical protein
MCGAVSGGDCSPGKGFIIIPEKQSVLFA